MSIRIAQGVTIPTPVFVGAICLVVGVLLGPALIASTKEGARWLERKATASLRGK